MASKFWIKLYHEMLDDPKVARLNDSTYRRFIECLLLAGEIDEGGLLPPLEDMAWRLRLSETALTQDLSRLALGEMVELRQHDSEERWFVSKFAERQAPSSATKRMREYRKRKRKEPKEKETNKDTYTDTYRAVTPVTNRNDNVTNYEHKENQAIRDIASKIAQVVKEPYGFGINEERFESAASVVMDWGAIDSIDGFSKWWEKNGHYEGKPALKSFLNEFQNYLSGVTYKNESNYSKQEKANIILKLISKYHRRGYKKAIPELKEYGLLDAIPSSKWVELCDSKPDQIQWRI